MTIRFTLLSTLGRGGMGVVWKARDSETGDIVALKLLHSLYVDDADYVARLEREVEIARRIDSPNVVKVLGYGRQDGVPCIAMEYVEGESLRERLQAGPLSWTEAKPIVRQVTAGLAAVHAAGVIHRDIKPSNILLASDGTAKLADFGIARANDLTAMTGSHTMLGTPAYIAPDGAASERGDLYALGCVLYEMLAGRPPFEGESQHDVWVKHLRERPDLRRLPDGESRRLARWLLEKDAAKRTPSAAALVGVLTRPSRAGPANRAARRGQLWTMGAAGVAIAVAVAAFTVIALSSGADAGPDGAPPTPRPAAPGRGVVANSSAGLAPPNGVVFGGPGAVDIGPNIVLYWDAVAGADSYSVQSNGAVQAVVSATSCDRGRCDAMVTKGLALGQRYCFRIVAAAGDAEGAPSTEVCGAAGGTAPYPTPSLHYGSTTPTAQAVPSPPSPTDSPQALPPSPTPTSNSMETATLTPSATASPTATRPVVTLPKAPNPGGWCGGVSSSGRICWDDYADNEDGFHVYLNKRLFATTGPNVTSIQVVNAGLSPGVIYCLTVDAFNAAGPAKIDGDFCFQLP